MAREWYPNGVYITIAPVLFGLIVGRYPRNSQPNACNGPAGYKPDVLTGCETYYYCHTDGLKEAFACPFGMLFDERRGQCDTWNNVNCPLPGQSAQQNAGILGVPEGSPPLLPPAAGQQQFSSYPAQDKTNYASYPLPEKANYPNSYPALPPPNPSANSPASANLGANGAGSSAMDFLAALLFPPLSGQQDLNDFVNTAPSGVRQSFMRVAGEGQLTPNQYPPYVEPLGPGGGNQQLQQQQRPVYQEQGLSPGGSAGVEGSQPVPSMRGRESPGSSGVSGIRRVLRPSPAMNPLDTVPGEMQQQSNGPMQQQAPVQPHSYGSGPVPPHLMGGHSSYMFGQLNMMQQQTQNQSGQTPMGVPGGGLAPVAGLTPHAQVEALRPLWQSLMRNPHQPHLRRMASLIAGGAAMDMGLVNGKMVTDPLGATAADPALAASKKNKALDDGLVDAR